MIAVSPKLMTKVGSGIVAALFMFGVQARAEAVNSDLGTVISADRLEDIKANAEMAISTLSKARGTQLVYDADSVRWVEGFVERLRSSDIEAANGVVTVVGCFLGEAILHATKGEWRDSSDGDLGIKFANGDWAFPLNKVRKQIEYGVAGGDSIYSFYDISVNFVATGQLGNQAEQ